MVEDRDVKATAEDNRPAIMRAMKRGLLEGLEDAMDKVVSRARRRAPRASGSVYRGIRRGPSKLIGDGAQVEGGAYDEASIFKEYGTAGRGEPVGSSYRSKSGVKWPTTPPGKKAFGPYPIKPKTKKALAFKVGKKQVFAKKVMHPGIAAEPYIRPAFDETVPEVPRIVSRRVSRRLEEAVGKVGDGK